eukprot:TRINITY_DN40726_c0_g1_i1.p1 TRINITY_DN40726_c0_g1~~TRINITY_DN40726_c0_g1_i1.p1  ORF type:complete len:536 (-),score=104.91 TRINITY_DN40726_c0_g1_i1:46-1596(-)
MGAMTGVVFRPFDRIRSLSTRLVWVELHGIVRAVQTAVEQIPGERRIVAGLMSVKHFSYLALEAFIAAEAFQWVSTFLVLSLFWSYYCFRAPPTELSYPIEFNYPGLEASMSRDLVVMPDAHMASPQFPSMACAEVALASLPVHIAALDISLNAYIPQESCPASPGMYKLQLLDDSGKEVTEQAANWRPLVVPRRHWIFHAWSALLWGPLTALGLVRAEDENVLAPLSQGLQLQERARHSLARAKACFSPSLLTLQSELHIRTHYSWPYNLMSERPVYCSIVLSFITALVTWSIVFLLLVWILLQHYLWTPAAPSKEAIVSSEQKVSTWTSSRFAIADSAEESAEKRKLVEVATEKASSVAAAASGALKQTSQNLREGGSHVLQAAASPEGRVTAASAASGAVALGAGGGCAGLLAGGVAGAACGVIPAFFTFGLSIPVGFVLGGGTGAVAGTAIGGSVGAVAGGAMGRAVYSNREHLAERAREAWQAADSIAQTPVARLKGFASSGTGSTESPAQ